MKNLKCKVGATILALVVLSVVIGILFSISFALAWLGNNVTMFYTVLGVFFAAVWFAWVWKGIYFRCVESQGGIKMGENKEA